MVLSQERNTPLAIRRLEGTVVLDGRVDEDAWQKLKPFPLVTHWPEFGNTPEDHTELRIAYDDHALYVSGVMNASPGNGPGGNEISASMNSRYGSYYDGRIFSVGLSPKWIASKFVEVSGSYQFNAVSFSNRRRSLESHIVRLRNLFALNTQFSISAFIQYNNIAHVSLTNVRLRYNPAEGTDFYLVYNEQFNSDRDREMPVLPRSQNRTILAKFTYTFGL